MTKERARRMAKIKEECWTNRHHHETQELQVMNKSKNILIIGLCMVVATMSGLAQKTNGKAADKLYEDLGYKVAIPEYEQLEVMSQQDLRRIANSFRLNHDTENAEVWYSQVVQLSQEPVDYLHYAQMLQSNGKLQEAKEYYLQYHEMLGGEESDKRGQVLANAIDRINDFKHSGVEIKNEEILNSENLDFSPAYYKNGVVFVSSRGVEKVGDGTKDKWIDDNFMALFFSEEMDDGSLANPEPFSYILTTKYHEGPVDFVQNGRKIFFTRNQYNNGKRENNSKGIMKQNIYSSTRSGEEWSDPLELPFNTVEYEEVHPAVSPDGTQLFFSSDRPGGYGEMDLYVVEKRGGRWGTPVNLGSQINTAGNELFPHVHDDGTLYFSSNGLGGIGGLDIFSTYAVDDSIWIKPENIGVPFNSKKDDFGFIMNTTGTQGYLTSARKGGFGADDIYSFKIGDPLNKEKKMLATVCVFDEKTTQRLEGAKVTITEVAFNGEDVALDEEFIMRLEETDKANEYILKLKRDLQNGSTANAAYFTDDGGEFSVELNPDKTYKMVATKNGYLVAEKTFGPSDDPLEFYLSSCVPIPMTFTNCLVLEGQTLNQRYKDKTVPGATVTMINLCTGDEYSTTSDKEGNYNFPCLECDCEFILKGEKSNFKDGVGDVSTIGEDCESGGILIADIYLTPSDRNDLLFAGNKIGVGSVLELKNIFYDFDQFYIRSEARPDLDHVVNLMKQFPSMIVELGSHTDARGTYEYNIELSQNRADAAVDYIVRRGIERRRIKARGYGETQLRNNCKNYKDCSEEEHQVNRRTEVTILSHNEDGLDVRYIDNMPIKIDRADPKRKFVWD